MNNFLKYFLIVINFLYITFLKTSIEVTKLNYGKSKFILQSDQENVTF